MSVLLIHPPVSKPCEPPPGIANLCGALQANGVRAAVLDMNLGGLLTLMEGVRDPTDTWTRRAVRNRTRHLDLLRNPAGYSDFSTYKRAILDVNRLLQVFGHSRGLNLTLANYQSQSHSPLRSLDLIHRRRPAHVLEAGICPALDLESYYFFSASPPATSTKWTGIDLALLILVLIAAVIGLRRLYPAFSLNVWLTLAVLFTRSMLPHLLASFSRYFLGLFPLFALPALNPSRHRRLAVIVIFFSFQVSLVTIFLWGSWVA